MKYEGTIDVIVEYNEEVRSPSITWKMPAVIRLHTMPKMQKRGVKFSRTNIYQRDGYCCQYCGKKFSFAQLSFDHVVPKSAGGRTVFENIVAACRKCNSKKDKMSCDESGMFPLKWPKRPPSLPIAAPVFDISKAPVEWQDYITQLAS